MAIVLIDKGLRLRQTFIEKLTAQFRTDSLQVRAAGRLAGADRVAQRTLALTKENLLSDSRQISRRFYRGDVELLLNGRQRRHLRHRQRREHEEPKDNRNESNDPREHGFNKEENEDPAPYHRETNQLQSGYFAHNHPSVWNGKC